MYHHSCCAGAPALNGAGSEELIGSNTSRFQVQVHHSLKAGAHTEMSMQG
jgi:hypothetical protein